MSRNKGDIAKTAFGFVLIIGIVNLFADMTYEGARSITGPFLGSLGASATVVGVVAGTGELLGYSLRSVAGYFADKTHRLLAERSELLTKSSLDWSPFSSEAKHRLWTLLRWLRNRVVFSAAQSWDSCTTSPSWLW